MQRDLPAELLKLQLPFHRRLSRQSRAFHRKDKLECDVSNLAPCSIQSIRNTRLQAFALSLACKVKISVLQLSHIFVGALSDELWRAGHLTDKGPG
jgi:hypothetical protein